MVCIVFILDWYPSTPAATTPFKYESYTSWITGHCWNNEWSFSSFLPPVSPQRSGGCLNIKVSSHQYRNSHSYHRKNGLYVGTRPRLLTSWCLLRGYYFTNWNWLNQFVNIMRRYVSKPGDTPLALTGWYNATSSLVLSCLVSYDPKLTTPMHAYYC